jgi:hypothetical protein
VNPAAATEDWARNQFSIPDAYHCYVTEDFITYLDDVQAVAKTTLDVRVTRFLYALHNGKYQWLDTFRNIAGDLFLIELTVAPKLWIDMMNKRL